MPNEEAVGATENLVETSDSSVAMFTTQLCFNLRRIQKPSTEVNDFFPLISALCLYTLLVLMNYITKFYAITNHIKMSMSIYF